MMPDFKGTNETKTGLLQFLLKNYIDRPDQLFIEDIRNDENCTYKELFGYTQSLIDALEKIDAQECSHVGFISENDWMFYPLLFACNFLNLTLIPINPFLPENDIKAIIKSANIQVIINHSKNNFNFNQSCYNLRDVIYNQKHKAPSQRNILFDKKKLEDPPPLIIIFTSGSTGQPKGVMISEKNILAAAHTILSHYDISDADRFYCVMPLYHMNSVMITGIVPFFVGSTVVLAPEFNFRTAKFYINHFVKSQSTILSFTPAIMATLLAISKKHESFKNKNIKFCFCGAAPLEADLWQKFESHFDTDVYQGYGLTETTFWLAMTPPNKPKNFQSVGIPTNCKLQITNKDINGHGLILVKSPMVMKGYYKSVLQDINGYFNTGDIGYIDADGHLYITGRAKDIFKKNGVLINPNELNYKLKNMAGIKEAYTIGVKDKMVGERIVVFYEIEKSNSEVKKADIIIFCRSVLQPAMMPDKLVEIDKIPKGPTGKVLKKEIENLLSGDFDEPK